MTYRLQDVFTAIADPSRRHILDLLSEKEMSVKSIADRFHFSHTAASKHLQVLRKTNLVQMRQKGRERIYRLNADPLLEVKKWVQQYEKFWDIKLRTLKEQIEGEA